LLTTIACDARGGPAYALEAAIFIAGAAIQWLRDGLGILATAAQSEELARGTSSTEGVYFVPALVGMGAPHWEPRARGTIVGLTRGSTRAHLVRAALEAMAYSTADVLEVMRARTSRGPGDLSAGAGRVSDGAPLRVDGGATENNWLMQFQADVLGVPVERPQQIETTALGAAGLAGLAAGIWPDVGAFQATREFTRFEPGAGREHARAGAAEWARAIRATLSWARDES
jgi:glycerol kinase